MRQPHRYALALLVLTLLALPALVAWAADDDGGERHRVIRVHADVDCDGEDCAEKVHKIEKHAVFVDDEGHVTRLSGDQLDDLEWVEGESVGPHELVFRGHAPRFAFRGGPEFLFGGGTFLGVSLTELTPELRTHFGADEDAGVMVSKVHEESPAWRAGLRVGDVITAVDGEPVASGRALARAIRGQEAGTTVGVEVLRDGRYERIDATLEERVVEKSFDFEWSGDGPFDSACGDAEECEVKVLCTGGDCDCTVNGEAAECEGLHGVHGVRVEKE